MSKYILSGPSRIPAHVWVDVVGSAVLGLRRSPARDAARVWTATRPPVALTGIENLPEAGPYVIIANHMNGPGVWVGFTAALITAVVERASPGAVIRTVGVAAYRDFRLFGVIAVPDAVTAFVFERFYRVYGVINMPYSAAGTEARGGGVRRILKSVKDSDVVILFPEGGNVSDFRMKAIQSGVGDLFRMLSRWKVPIVPISVFPEGDTFSVSVGRQLQISESTEATEIEQCAGYSIATMLPPELRGPFAEDA
jgi:1-acyl-sn-glycerol-3-phosphate acyltransferase